MKSSEQIRRMLRLVPYLQEHPHLTAAQAAEFFQVSPKTLLDDLEVLQFCGLPGGFTDDLFEIDVEAARQGEPVFVNTGDVLRTPPKLYTDEAVSLLVALAALREVADSEQITIIETLIERLRSACGIVSERIELEIEAGQVSHRKQLATAIEHHRIVELDYRGIKGRSVTRIHPARMRILDGRSYLDAWNPQRDAWRSYRLDRIESVTLTHESFEPRDDIEQVDLGWFVGQTRSVTLTLRPRASWVAESYPVESVHETGEYLEVKMPVGSPQWLVSLILRLGADVVAVSDQTLAAQVRQLAREALAHYGAVLSGEVHR